MTSFYERANQDLFIKAFGGLNAGEAANLILGRQNLTEEQTEALKLATGNGGYRLRFDPDPVGHFSFRTCGTRGTGNSGWHLLVPATEICRRMVSLYRREAFAERLQAPRKTADALFTLARGYEPVLSAIVALWPYLSTCPSMPDRALRDAGFRPGHPHDGAAIKVVRRVLNV